MASVQLQDVLIGSDCCNADSPFWTTKAIWNQTAKGHQVKIHQPNTWRFSTQQVPGFKSGSRFPNRMSRNESSYMYIYIYIHVYTYIYIYIHVYKNIYTPSGKHTKNYGKSPFYSWENPLFRLGYF